MTDVFTEILNMSLTGSVVIAIVLAARLGLKRAPKIFSYALWAVVLFRLLCPVSLPSPVSLLELTKPQVTEVQGITSSVSYLPARIVTAEARETAVPVSQTDVPRQEPETAPVAVMTVYSMVTYARLRCRLIGAIRYRGNVYLADHITSPFVLGVLRPKIYLPSNTPVHERRFIMAHERHHIRRGDHIVKLLAYAALCLHWFNPLVWVSFMLAGKDMEMSCDEAVIKKLGPQIRADYSASLLRLATGQRIIAGTPLAFGEGDTKGRVLNMANWKKPKLWVSIICIVICVFLLVACAVNPETETTENVIPSTETVEGEQTAEEIAFEKVKAVFDAVQSGSHQIYAEQKNEGSQGPSGYVSSYGYDDGNWFHVTEMVLEGTNLTDTGEYYNRQAYLCHKGYYYSNEGHWGEQGAIEWSEWSGRETLTPKLSSFLWEKGSVTYMDTVTDENGQCFLFRIDKLYADVEGYDDHYFANFYFDPDGNFRNVQFLANRDQDNAFTVTESIVTLDSDTVAEQIDSYYAYGIPVKETTGKPVISGSTITTNAELVQYGALAMTLPEGYTCREENGSIILTKDGADVGGITCWALPDSELIIPGRNTLETSNMAEWVKALGLPEAQESDEPIAYMIENSLYGDLEAEYWNELEPEKLNVEHHFFIDGDLVYDVYYNQNLISDGKAGKFLKTIQLSGEPVVTPDPSEEGSLAKCHNVLSLIQSGSFCIASDQENTGTIALNDYSYSKYWQHDGNWLSVTEIPESGASSFFYYMEVDGVHYNTERTGWDETGPLWAEQKPVEVAKPWLATFQWNDETVAYMDTLYDGGEECVMLRIDEPYPYGEGNSGFYFVKFYFVDGGAFLRADLSVNLFMDNAFDVKESIVTLDAETVAAEIETQYTRARETE